MATARHTISLSISNNKFALKKSEQLFDNCLSKYINYLISREREKVNKKARNKEVLD